VSTNSFQFQIDEWDYLDGAHGSETIGYLVAEAGVYRLEAGARFEAGHVSVGHDFRAVDFRQTFGTTPVILTQVQTYVDEAAVTTRQRAASATGFQVKVQEQEASDGQHAQESVGYIAIEPGSDIIDGIPLQASYTPDAVTNAWYSLSFARSYTDPVLVAGVQTTDEDDPAALRYRSLGSSGVQVFIEEEKSADPGIAHSSEVVGYIVLEKGDDDDGEEEPPPAPTGLSPSGSVTITTSPVTLSCDAITGVSEYEFVIEYESGGSWSYYYAYSKTSNSATFWPQYDDTRYRWRVRARNAQGWGPWSGWATFNFGDAGTGVPPAPTGLSPSGGVTITTSSVSLSCDAISGVSEYEFEIEYESGGSWYYYYTYSKTSNSATFWPQVQNTRYRWRVRARNAHGWGPWSGWATFRFS
jgi:hypothetical protein